MVKHLARTRIWLLVAAVLVTAACTSQTKLREAELDELATWLPGIYDNQIQVDAEHSQGRTVHEAVRLSVISVYAPMLSDAVFYLSETANDDLRRVLTQRIISFTASKDGRIIETIYTFAEPTRWREGERDPDLFKSMVEQDLHEATGCEMAWHKAGGRFKGTNDPHKCRTASLSTGMLVSVEATMDLGREDLVLDQHAIDAAGVPDSRSAPSDFHFTKRAGALQ